MVVTAELDVFRVGDLARHPAAPANVDVSVAGPVQDQGWDADRAQQLTDVDSGVHAAQSDCGTRACAHAKVACPPVSEAIIRIRSKDFDVSARAPLPLEQAVPALPFFLSRRPRILGVPDTLCVGAVHHEGRGSLREAGRKNRTHWPTFGDSEEGRPA